MHRFGQRHTQPLLMARADLQGRTTEAVEVISLSWSLKREASVCSSTEMASIFGAMATSTSTLPADMTLSAPKRPRPNISAKAKVVNSMSPPSTTIGRAACRDSVKTGSGARSRREAGSRSAHIARLP
jgi:hypothetical protein